MSWAAHNPEGWAEVELTAVKRYLLEHDNLDTFLSYIHENSPEWTELFNDVPAGYISDAEADYLLERYGQELTS